MRVARAIDAMPTAFSPRYLNPSFQRKPEPSDFIRGNQAQSPGLSEERKALGPGLRRDDGLQATRRPTEHVTHQAKQSVRNRVVAAPE